MTIETQTPRVVIIGNGTRGPYSLVDSSGQAIRFMSTSHIRLTRYSASTDDNNDGSLLVENTDYSVGGTQDARTFTLIGSQAVLTSSQRIVAERVQTYTQDLDLTTGGAFSATAVEARLDKIAEFQQELKAQLARAPKLQFADSTADVAFPSPPTSATVAIGRNTSGALVHLTPADFTADVVLGTGWQTHLANGLPQFYLDDYYTTTWEAALNAANTAAAAAGGGIIYAHGREEYAFTGYPSELSAGVYVFGIPNYTRFKMPTTGATQALLDWRGSLGSSYTLSTNASNGAETISLSSVSGLSAGDIIRIQRTPGGSITLGTYTQLARIEEIDGTTVTLNDLLDFAVQTSDTYTIRKLTTNVGGGAYGIIFDGAGNTSETWCVGVFAQYCEGMFFDLIGGENMSGAEPMDGTTTAGVIHLWGCFDTRGLTDLWAYKSGSGSGCAIQFREMGPTIYGAIHTEFSTGFGCGWYDSTHQHVATVLDSASFGRAGKMQCVLGFHIDSLRATKTRFTGFAVTEGSRGHIGAGTYHPTDLEYFEVTSIVRASNVATITFAEPLYTYDSGHTFVIAGATGANDFNGTVTLVRVGTTGNVYTYANVGTDETAGGTITCNLNRSPSFWVNNTGCNVVVDYLEFHGPTNPAGDVHTGSTDSVRIGVLRTDAGVTPTFAGTAGSSSQGTGRHIFDVNGVHYLPNGLTIAAGGLTMTGQLSVTHTGAVPARFTGDDNQYVTALSSAATSGSSGFSVTVKDSGGTNRSFTIQNAAGTPRLVNAYTTPTEIWMNGSEVGEFLNAGGMRFGSHDFVTAQGGVVLRSFTAANIADVANAVNTTGKVAGLMVYDTTNNRIMISSGSAAASPWYVADASASVTPA